MLMETPYSQSPHFGPFLGLRRGLPKARAHRSWLMAEALFHLLYSVGLIICLLHLSCLNVKVLMKKLHKCE